MKNEIDKGWIKLHRNIQEHWIWGDPVKFQWWVDLAMTVNHTDAKVNLGFELFDCKRGQSLNSLETWAKKWRVDVSTVRRFFKMLRKDGMIKTENVRKTTRLTVCNYDHYNSPKQSTQLQDKCEPTQEQLTGNTNKNVKNNKNDKNTLAVVLNVSFDDFYNLYDKKTADRARLTKKWSSLKDEERTEIMQYIPRYKKHQPDKQYRKNPDTFINQRAWENEIIGEIKTAPTTYKQAANNDW